MKRYALIASALAVPFALTQLFLPMFGTDKPLDIAGIGMAGSIAVFWVITFRVLDRTWLDGNQAHPAQWGIILEIVALYLYVAHPTVWPALLFGGASVVAYGAVIYLEHRRQTC